jgi:hypothetical protein
MTLAKDKRLYQIKLSRDGAQPEPGSPKMQQSSRLKDGYLSLKSHAKGSEDAHMIATVFVLSDKLEI